MRRLAAVILVMSFLGLGSGTSRWAHEFAHHSEPAPAEAAPGSAHPPGDPHDHRHPHDESTCELYTLLNAPLALAQAPGPLVESGQFVAFHVLPPTPVQRLRLPTRIHCRGPPAFLA